MTESVDITYFLSEHYFPSLVPVQFREHVKQLLLELHDLNYFSLTYTHKPQRAADMEKSVLKALYDPAISNRYREALKFKLEV